MVKFTDRLAHAFNAFTKAESAEAMTQNYGPSAFGPRPARARSSVASDKSFTTSIYTRIAIDAAAIDIQHVRLDNNQNFVETIDSGLNNCLTLEANIDQSARHFKQDLIMTLCQEGVIAIVPTDTSVDPTKSAGFDITTMRVGKVLETFPQHVRVELYNEKTGNREQIILSKKACAVVENPLFDIMNQPNGLLQRLIRKLTLLDQVDEASSSGKLDIIIQLPYPIKTEARREQAEERLANIEDQLTKGSHGIAYTDATEKITQLNRPAENNMLAEITRLTEQVYGQLGMSAGVFLGTATESEMLNYFNRTIEPMLAAVTLAMKRVFLSKTARSQKQSVEYYRDPFTLVEVGKIAEIADLLSRNEIMTPNEIRAVLRMRPADDGRADQLLNRNMPIEKTATGRDLGMLNPVSPPAIEQ